MTKDWPDAGKNYILNRMHDPLIPNPTGHYHFLKGIDPYSCGVVADPGFELIRIQPSQSVPWREGFELIHHRIKAEGLPKQALCAMELRSPAPFSMDGFISYNREYRAVLEDWEILVNGMNPMARTNVAPVIDPPAEVSLHAFTLVRPSATSRKTFIVAGAGELREGILNSDGIIRRGEFSQEAILEKARYVLDVMRSRLAGLGVGWNNVTATNVYTRLPERDTLAALIGTAAREANRFGICWHETMPPVVDIEFEMDLRGLLREEIQ